MRALLLVGCELAIAARVRELAPDPWVVDEVEKWAEAVRRLRGLEPPDLILFTSDVLTPTLCSSLPKLRRKRYLVPSAVLMKTVDPGVVHRAGRIHRHGVEPIFGITALNAGVGRLLARAPHPLSRRLRRNVPTEDPTWWQLVDLLEQSRGSRSLSTEALAREIGMSRSVLYRRLQSAGLPSPTSVQSLFRLWPGITRIIQGGSIADAAFEGERPDSTAFRRALGSHFGMTVNELRHVRDPDEPLRRWLVLKRGGDAENS